MVAMKLNNLEVIADDIEGSAEGVTGNLVRVHMKKCFACKY